jgi:hypothetical protein
VRHVRRSGTYVRVADPSWENPLDAEYSRGSGGRWNAPGSFGVVYLNKSLEVARAQVRHKLEPRGIHPEDLSPERGPVLVHTEVPEKTYVDAVSDPGLRSLGLPTTYPFDRAGSEVPHAVCQPIGQSAHDEGEPGIACRSAAAQPSPGEELAYFSGERLTPIHREPWTEWFWPGGAPSSPPA